MTGSVQLGASYERTFHEMLFTPDWNRHSRGAILTAFWPQCGPDYSPTRDLLFVGRATNKWGASWEDGTWFRRGRPPRVSAIREYPESNGNQLEWTEDSGSTYRARSSPFWQVIRDLAARNEGEWHSGWSRRVAWSNLLKVNFAKRSGNPTEDIRHLQLPWCRELLKMEIRTFRPKAVVFLTGSRPLEELLDPERSSLSSIAANRIRPVVGRVFGRRIVVSPHPQGAVGRHVPTQRLAKWIRACIP